MFEELFIEGEQYDRTQHEKILIARNASNHISTLLDGVVMDLHKAANQNDASLIRALLKQIVVGYQPYASMVAASTDLSQQLIADVSK